MAKGDGIITSVRNKKGEVIRNRWRVCVYLGRDPLTGRQNWVTRIVNGTKTDAKRVRNQLIEDYENGLRIEEIDATFKVFAEEWASNRRSEGSLSERTYRNDEATIRCLSSYIGDVKLRDIDARLVERVYAKIRSDKSKRLGRPVSGTTMVRIHATFKQILKKAVNYDLILRNPCDRVEAPKLADSDRVSLSADEAARLLHEVDQAEEHAYELYKEKEERQRSWGSDKGRKSVRGIKQLSDLLAVRLALATGMRRGEIFGLTWDDIDLKRGLVTVRRSLTVYGTLKKTKTAAGMRTIFIDGKTREHLHRWREFQVSALHTLRKLDSEASEPQGDQPVLCSNTCDWYDLRNFGRWWRSWRAEKGFKDLKFHELRHTQATQLLAHGVDIKTVQTRMGHANASLTLNWYAHTLPENDRDAANLIGDLFANDTARDNDEIDRRMWVIGTKTCPISRTLPR